MIFLKHHHTVRGFSLLGIFVALACTVVIMSIYMSSVQKAVTGGTGTSSKTSVWGMQDQIQLQLISKALTMSAIMGGDSLLIPSDISGSRESFDNTSANFWSALIMENLVKSEQLVSPTDRGWVEVAKYNYYAGDWDPNFSADLNTTSNVSYAHMPLWGERLKKRWNTQSGRYPILSNRGPQDGVEGSTSITLDDDGTWRGWVVHADGSIDWQDGTTTSSRWNRRDGVMNDNIFLMEEEDSKEDAILGFTDEMDDYGPILIWD
ncbi:MAG: hypothetical protein VX436_03215 [Planctomycetota bacterium]|nr:hypothetical protein [Planctomycetota bacterium]